VSFDHRPREFPIARVVPQHGTRATIWLGDLARWLCARWAWLRPRTIPLIVAGLGMIAMLAFSDYLAHNHGNVLDSSVAPGVDVYAK
jgi:hypothetical protein